MRPTNLPDWNFTFLMEIMELWFMLTRNGVIQITKFQFFLDNIENFTLPAEYYNLKYWFYLLKSNLRIKRRHLQFEFESFWEKKTFVNWQYIFNSIQHRKIIIIECHSGKLINIWSTVRLFDFCSKAKPVGKNHKQK